MKRHEIEVESFRIIQSELGDREFTDSELAVVVRVIHATADFDFHDTLRFHPAALPAGIDALRQGAALVTDVRMVQMGISPGLLAVVGGQPVCDVQHPGVYKMARDLGLTRSAAAMRRNADLLTGGVAVIGNAPTALLEVIRLVREESVRPALIVGVPVGFVQAVESKDRLMELEIPFVTAVGRKGGSTIAVAIVNALLRLAACADGTG